MKTVDVPLGDRSYPIYIGEGLLDKGELLKNHVPGKRVLIVTNETISPLYLQRLVSSFFKRHSCIASMPLLP
jgi:3-dehydroquinate synthase